ncbi:unnamed protein product [Tuber melanosporum]|uniref:(Perigord truffle) hypothetical protein n=1 Tax=Tuber melanosporum (strain Mel28) TaxID=656061 RepID=D5GK58_TUBMM|nr:uncharacterized protein GSTUM_00009378001 [Tuber melanosporum]CAZ84901.1 unnamed protein product [Tuber melanosporum]
MATQLIILPPELLVEILQLLPDFATLHSLTLAHPRFNNVLHANPTTICSSVAESDFAELYPLALSILPEPTPPAAIGIAEATELLHTRSTCQKLVDVWRCSLLETLGFTDGYGAPILTRAQNLRILTATYRFWRVVREPHYVSELDNLAILEMAEFVELLQDLQTLGGMGDRVEVIAAKVSLQNRAKQSGLKVCVMDLRLVREWFGK